MYERGSTGGRPGDRVRPAPDLDLNAKFRIKAMLCGRSVRTVSRHFTVALPFSKPIILPSPESLTDCLLYLHPSQEYILSSRHITLEYHKP